MEIFHHFGSGLLADADNFFSKDFIVNPFMFENEEKELQEKKITLTRCFVHKDAKIAFVYDMFVNQIIELSRTNKHGSCGCGVWETLKRYETVCNKTVGELYHLNNTELEDYIKFCPLVSLSRAEELIKEYCKQTQCVTILITHSLEQARRMSDEIIEIDYGKIIKREVLE